MARRQVLLFLALLLVLWVGLAVIPAVIGQAGGPGACPDPAVPCPDDDDNEDAGGGGETQPSDDTDGDGIPNGQDQCPNAGGPASFNGCPPPPDADGDGTPDESDACPSVGGPAGNNGCPQDTAAPTEIPTVTGPAALNPVRPDPEGECMLATNRAVAVNVRAQPSLFAPIVGVLDPSMTYPVLGAAISNGELWYRVEGGWVSASVVTVDGNCPIRDIEIIPGALSLNAAVFEEVEGGIFPETECFELPDGTRYCVTELAAVAEGEGGETEGQIGGDVVVCGGIPPVNFCVVLDFSIEYQDPPPEFFEPEGEEPPPPPPPPGGEGEDEGQPLCDDVLDDLIAATDEPVMYAVYSPGGGLEIAANLPPIPPNPCRGTVHVVRRDQSANGVVPVDQIVFELDQLPPTVLDLRAASGEDGGHAHLYDSALLDLEGNVCIPFTHGDYSICPTPPDPDDPGEEPGLTPDDLDDLMSTVPGGDPTGYYCHGGSRDGEPVIACFCFSSNSDDCFDLASNVCANEDITCVDDVCGCVFPDEAD